MQTNILVLAPLKNGSGNLTTADRIRSYIQKSGHKCDFKCVSEFNNPAALQQYVDEHDISLIVAMHAFHSGVLLKGIPTRYIMILGGTDVHVSATDPDKLTDMAVILGNARRIISLGPSLARDAQSLWPTLDKDKFCIIPQAVMTRPSTTFRPIDYLINNNFISAHHAASSQIFLLVAGIRPVKQPLFLVKAFSEWHTMKRPDAYLVILGPRLDMEYTNFFLQEIESVPGIIYIPGLGLEETHSFIRDSTCVVNSSISEGMSVAILEALALGVPVIARDIPGNADIIEDDVTGLLYDVPQKFLERAEMLLSSEDRRQKLIWNGRCRIETHHCVASEENSYMSLITDVLAGCDLMK